MRTMKLFERELNLIKSESLRKVVYDFMNDSEYVPDYFWTDGASASGRYHPKFAHGLGGTVRHTKAAIMFAEELLRMSSYAYMKEEYKDFVIAAILLHDTVKYGFGPNADRQFYADHAGNAAIAFEEYCTNYTNYKPHFLLLQAMRSHMGQWSTCKEDRPFTSVDRCVHMADYMASRSFIDIPSITEEYNEIACQWATENHELPF